MRTSNTRTTHIEVPTDMFELPTVQAYAKALLSGTGALSTIAKTIAGTSRPDLLVGTRGADVIRGGNGIDRIFGKEGNDKLYGQKGADFIWGGAGKDLLDGGAGIDNLIGGDGDDKLVGGADNDDLSGGKGADMLTGGSGRDNFLLMLSGVDRITDFEPGADKVTLEFAPGVADQGTFVLGTAAKDADDRIIYDQTTGYLYYDADGNGSGAAVLFAINVRKSDMVWYDFF